MAYQLRRLPDAPWLARDGHAMLSARLGVADDALYVLGGWNQNYGRGANKAEREANKEAMRQFPGNTTSDIWRCLSLADLEKGKWEQVLAAARWPGRHSFPCVKDGSGQVHVIGPDAQSGSYLMDHWISMASSAAIWRRTTTAMQITIPGAGALVANRILGFGAHLPATDDVLFMGGEAHPGFLGGAAARPTDIVGYKFADGGWRTVLANCPALPRSGLQKAIVHSHGGTDYLYIFTGGNYDRNDLPRSVWRCPVANVGNAGSWVQVLAEAPWVGRIYSCIETFDGKLWMICGSGVAGNLGDIWYSADGGVTWTQLANAVVANRHAHATTVIWGKMIIAGGSEDTGTTNKVHVLEVV